MHLLFKIGDGNGTALLPFLPKLVVLDVPSRLAIARRAQDNVRQGTALLSQLIRHSGVPGRVAIIFRLSLLSQTE